MASNKLNFSSDRLITGINIVDNILFFTDNETEPKKINIDDFKAANHSSGTTHIYNREFLERDITVIRPHPPTAIKTTLTDSEDVNIEAEDPQIITEPYVATTSSTALLKGKSINGGAFFKKRGFYYLELDSDTLPNENTLISSGTLVEVGNDGNEFEFLVPNLTSGSKYFFLAFGQTTVNEQVTGRIYSFRIQTTGGTLDISTEQPFRKENLVITLKGKIQDDGGANVFKVGFYYKIVSALDVSSAPTTLHSNGVPLTNVIKVIGEKVFNNQLEFNYDLQLNAANKKIYIQAFGENANGEDQGTVVAYTANNAQRPKLITNYNGQTERYEKYAFLCGKVENGHGKITTRGFYFSSKTKEFQQLKEESNSGVFKITDTSLSALNSLQKFTYDTRLQGTPAQLTKGEPIYYMAWATNDSGLTGYGKIEQADYLEEKTSGITTEPPIIDFVGPDGLPCGFRSGCNNTPTLFCKGYLPSTEGLNIEKVSFYVTRTPAGTTLAIDENAKKQEMKKRISLNTATEVRSLKAGSIFGHHQQAFGGDKIIPSIGIRFDYHVCAVAIDSNGDVFLGNVIRVVYGEKDVSGTVQTNKTNPSTTNTATFNGVIKDVKAGGGTITNAGFAFATSLNTLKAIRNANSPSGQIFISSGDLATLNSFITSGAGNGNFSVQKTGLTANTKYFVQAFYVKGGEYIYAKENNLGSVYDGEDIDEFTTTALSVSAPEGFNLFIWDAVPPAEQIVINAELESNRNLLNMSPTYYYKETSSVVGASEALKKSDIRSTGTSASITVSVPLASNSSASRVVATIPNLNPETQYSIIVVANNGHTQSVTSGFAAGEFSTRIGTSTTGKTKSKPLPGDVVVTDITEDSAKFSFLTINNGGDIFTNITPKFVYIKASDFSGTTPEQLEADSDALEESANVFYVKTVDDLEPNTDYKVIAVLTNTVGSGYSRSIVDFKTKGGTENVTGENTIFAEDSFPMYAFDGTPHGNRYIKVLLSPSNANYTVKVDPWFNDPYSIPVSYRRQTDSNGNKVIELTVPRNGKTEMRRCEVKLLHSLDPSKTTVIAVYQDGNPHYNGQTHYPYGNPFEYDNDNYDYPY